MMVKDATSGVEAALSAVLWAVGLGLVEWTGSTHVVLPSLESAHWAQLSGRLTRIRDERSQ